MSKRKLQEQMEHTNFNSFPSLVRVDSINPIDFDCAIIILESLSDSGYFAQNEVLLAKSIDDTVGKRVSFHQCEEAPGRRIVVSPIGPINRDQDDIRRWADAGKAGIARAKQAGSVNPLVLFSSAVNTKTYPEYGNALQVTILGIYQELYVGIQAREAKGKSVQPIEKIGLYYPWLSASELTSICSTISAIESGRRLARDLGDADPERMSPEGFTIHVEEAFEGLPIKVTVKSNQAELEKTYPLLMAVARGSRPVLRHLPRVIRLEYQPEGEVKETLYLVGKGVTYDTGGLDIKTGGIMAGMSRDKCGASNVAGFLLICALLKPKNLRVVAELGVVRNSVDSESYAADEIITGHSGVRVKVMNTDAEGRLVMADCLSHLREEALKDKAPNPRFFTFATLTGHIVRSIGPYTAIMDNGPARAIQQGERIREAGESWGDCCDCSRLRRDDFQALTKDDPSFDVMQLSQGTTRGHQYASVFLAIASGLDKYGRDSSHPLPYSHLDIAGSAVENSDYQFGKVTAAGLLAITAAFVLTNCAL